MNLQNVIFILACSLLIRDLAVNRRNKMKIGTVRHLFSSNSLFYVVGFQILMFRLQIVFRILCSTIWSRGLIPFSLSNPRVHVPNGKENRNLSPRNTMER